MSEPSGYTPPKIWVWDQKNGGEFSKINRPVAGATHDKALPVGKHPLQLYSLATPNGVKVTMMLVSVATPSTIRNRRNANSRRSIAPRSEAAHSISKPIEARCSNGAIVR